MRIIYDFWNIFISIYVASCIYMHIKLLYIPQIQDTYMIPTIHDFANHVITIHINGLN